MRASGLRSLREAMYGIRVPMGRLSSVIVALAAARRRSSTFPFHSACRRISATSSWSFSSANSAVSCSGWASGGREAR